MHGARDGDGGRKVGGGMLFPDLVPHALVALQKRGVPVIGEREARLLEAVDRVRSIKDAASEAGISYRTALSMIQQMERHSAGRWSSRAPAGPAAEARRSPTSVASSSDYIRT